MNRVGIDAHAIGLQQGGNERYIEGLLKGLSEIETHPFRFIVFLNEKAQIPDFLKNNPTFEFKRVSSNPGKRFLFDLSNTKRYGIELLHTQYHVPFKIKIPSVITLHDVSYLTHPEFFPISERLKMKFMMPYSIKKAKKIITVSEFSKMEILRFYKKARGKTCAIYNGISDCFKPASKAEIQQTLEKHKIGTPYILTVSNLQPRKNLKGLIDSFSKIQRKNPGFPCSLVIVGRKLWLYDEIFVEIRNSEFNEKIIITGYLSNQDIISLYSAAEMFVYVSFYEGFGFPPVEAMACGCPVITSNTSSLPEITGEASIKVNPKNSDEIASTILQLYHDKNLREKLVERGFIQAKKFSWSECAKKTIKVYKEVISHL
ncbi:MAG: glycosyltransferase family 4 protein [Candidatus Omnitrophica bacterium]|nr:glycosyltransferase family 4 protein [Candidatus Omnitrophota bacterium]